MHTLSTRTMSALAFDRGEEYDPGEPLCPQLLADLALLEQAGPVIGEDGPYERARQRRRERSQLAAHDLIAAPWETAQQRLV